MVSEGNVEIRLSAELSFRKSIHNVFNTLPGVFIETKFDGFSRTSIFSTASLYLNISTIIFAAIWFSTQNMNYMVIRQVLMFILI